MSTYITIINACCTRKAICTKRNGICNKRIDTYTKIIVICIKRKGIYNKVIGSSIKILATYFKRIDICSKIIVNYSKINVSKSSQKPYKTVNLSIKNKKINTPGQFLGIINKLFHNSSPVSGCHIRETITHK